MLYAYTLSSTNTCYIDPQWTMSTRWSTTSFWDEKLQSSADLEFQLKEQFTQSCRTIEDFYERLEMLPKKITLREDQLAVFKDTINHVSFYQTNSQRTKVILKKEKTEVV